MAYKIVNFKDYSGGIEAAARYYHSKWGSESNFGFFFDAVKHSSNSREGLPRFYLMLKGEEIVGCSALVTNDFNSRHDLWPWLAGLYIEESERGKGLGSLLMLHLEEEAAKAGYNDIYLITSHDGYYEKYGWTRMEDCYEPNGETTRLYTKGV